MGWGLQVLNFPLGTKRRTPGFSYQPAQMRAEGNDKGVTLRCHQQISKSGVRLYYNSCAYAIHIFSANILGLISTIFLTVPWHSFFSFCPFCFP